MNFKRLILGGACVAGALSCLAADNYLHVQTSKGWTVLDLNKVERLTFSAGVMTATDASNAVVATFPQAELDNMYVSESAGISEIVADSTAEATFRYDSKSREIIMLADGNLCIYNVVGKQLVGIKGVKKGQSVDLGAISEEIVIIKSGDYAVKALLK